MWAGIRRAVSAVGYAGEARWLESHRAALHILRKAGVTVRILSLGPLRQTQYPLNHLAMALVSEQRSSIRR